MCAYSYSTAMKMVGHKTESIYRRYAIVDEAMLKEGAAKLQSLHDAQAPAAPVIPLIKATRMKRVSSSTVRVSRARRERRNRAARAKALKASEKTMVGWDGIEPPTPGFSVLCFPSHGLPLPRARIFHCGYRKVNPKDGSHTMTLEWKHPRITETSWAYDAIQIPGAPCDARPAVADLMGVHIYFAGTGQWRGRRSRPRSEAA